MVSGNGLKESYSTKEMWRLKMIPEDVAIDLFVASNKGESGSIERIEAVDEAIALAKLNHPELFRQMRTRGIR